AAFAELTELLASAAPDEPAAWAAFGVAERGRARSFRYALSQTTRSGDTGSLDASAEARDDMLSRVSAVFQGDHEDDLADFVQRLDRLGAGPLGSFTARERSALHRRLASLDAVLVQYAAGPRGMFAFIVDGTRIRLARLGDREAIASVAARLAEQLRDREAPAGHVRASARELARHVWWPVAPFADAKRVLIAPDDTLHLVPFAVLPWSEASDDRLLVHRVEIATVPSALFVAGWSGGSRASTAARDLALVGDPVFRAAEWRRRCAGESAPTDSAAGSNAAPRAWTEWMPSLPASRDEVLAIAALAQKPPRRQVETYLGCMATGDSVRRAARENHAVLHIATHGRIDARRPRLSALALTPDADEPEDASFGLLEILDLDLHARLVTLSACDTFGGRLLRGEGVLGPAQAFLQAGASSVVASHWRVEDETTARFMRALYGRLLDENMSIAEALRRTQLAEQTVGTSYSWAAFALYGRPDTRI
ncbi:MAG: CHAT domain-containing protein, partial [Steroidobacteraceae bacterium]